MQNFINQLVYFGFLQSLFLLVSFLLSARVRRGLNGYIAFLVFVLLIGLSGRVLYLSDIFGKDFRLIAFSEFATLLFGSTVYLFTRSSLLNEKFSYSQLRHYVPALIYSLAVIFYFMIPDDATIGSRAQSGELRRAIALFMGVALAFNITYWAMSYQTFLSFKKELNNEFSYVVKTRFFQSFLIAIGLCLLCWITVWLISLFGDPMTERASREVIWLSIAFIILFIAYYGIKAPELFRVGELVATKKYAQSKLSHNELEQLKTKLETLMLEKKPYLNRKLLKADLAEMLGVSNPEVARLLNESIGMNFFEYVNYYRIKEFVELARTDRAKNLTFFGLAQEAGFNSKTTFNKSFKKLMGTSPKEYFINKTN